MRQSQYFAKTSKTVSKDDVSVNAKFLEQGGFIHKEMAGVYSFLPLGLRVLTKIENIIREEMNAIGANEILMSTMQPKENWLATDRWNTLDVLFKVESRHGYELALGPTHEEIVTPLSTLIINSYKDLPKAVYQIQTKFRDEPRARSGLLRGREFRMKDLYSFHADEADLTRYYKIVSGAYKKIFNRLQLDALYTEASGGSFSKFSHEFQVEIPNGEDAIYVCSGCSLAVNKEIFQEGQACTNCKETKYREAKASEVANIFELKTKYSDAFNLKYTAEDGSKKSVVMGCYGLGSSRAMGVAVEKFNDEAGIIWPDSIAPFQVHLIALKGAEFQADKIYQDLQAGGIEVLYDDREGKTAGEKFADSDLIGIPYRVVVSEKTLAEDSVEVKKRSEDATKIVQIKELQAYEF